MDSPSTNPPGDPKLASEILSLLSTYPPTFLYINDPVSPRITTSTVLAVLDKLSSPTTPTTHNPSFSKLFYAHVNAVACFTPRLLYDTILNGLMKWEVKWNDGCGNWSGGDQQRHNANFDAFLHGLRAVDTALRKEQVQNGGRKDPRRNRGVIVVERAERLKDRLPELLVPLTRLSELSQLDLCVIFVSTERWEDIRPPLGASPEPYYIDVVSPSKDAIIQNLIALFLQTTESHDSPFYQPALQALYANFASVLCDVCYPFTHDLHELQYISAARWPGFAQPVLDSQRSQDSSEDDGDIFSEPDIIPPSEDIRMRLSKYFNPSMTGALEHLYPRLTNATDWSVANRPESDLLDKPPAELGPIKVVNPNVIEEQSGLETLPRMSKFILVAAYLASMNPTKSDIRMFGRGLDEKKRKRRRTHVTKASKTSSGKVQIPQHFIGPSAFPLDRVIAILGALLEDNDVEQRPPAPEYTIPGEYTDMEIRRVWVFSSVMELTSMRLMHRTSSPERLDGPPMFMCGVSYEIALALARQLDLPLNDLLWDPK